MNNPAQLKKLMEQKQKGLTDEQRAYLQRQAKQSAEQGTCDPLYRDSIQQMLEQQKNDPMQTSLVVCNSFDFELDDIKEDMIDSKIYAEVFEIDRLHKDHRVEYLNCFQDMFKTKKLPMIFLKDQFIGDYSALRSHSALN